MSAKVKYQAKLFAIFKPMVWQDIIIAAAQIFFIVALIPSLTTKDKPALTTSVMNTILVWSIAATQCTLHLWFSAVTAGAIGIGHATLAVQKAKINRAQ